MIIQAIKTELGQVLVMLPMQEVEIRRISVQSQPQANSLLTILDPI
jgi:hypothetical protein